MSACGAVLATTELLEEILLHLPLRSLLHAKRVCKKFAVTIDRSVHIRQALWLEPASEKAVPCVKDTRCNHDTFTPRSKLSGQRLGEACAAPIINPFMVMGAVSLAGWRFKEERDATRPLEGPRGVPIGVYFNKGESVGFAGSWVDRRPCSVFAVDGGEEGDLQDLFEMLTASQARFKNMLLTKPPVRQISLRDEMRFCEPVDYREDDRATYTAEQGMRVGEFMAVAIKHMMGVTTGGVTRVSGVEIVGARAWKVLASGVDEITGWEMLEMLAMNNESLGFWGKLLR